MLIRNFVPSFFFIASISTLLFVSGCSESSSEDPNPITTESSKSDEPSEDNVISRMEEFFPNQAENYKECKAREMEIKKNGNHNPYSNASGAAIVELHRLPKCASSANKFEYISKEIKLERLTSKLPKGDVVDEAKYVQLSGLPQLAYKYYAFHEGEVEYEKIASLISREYQSEFDVFKKKDMLAKLKINIDSEISAAKLANHFTTDIDHFVINQYDEKNKWFLLTSSGDLALSPSQWFFFDNSNYSYQFSNGHRASKIVPVNEDQARAIESIRAKSPYGNFQMKVYCYAQGLVDGRIQMFIQKAVVLDGEGKEVFSFQPT